uniref:Chemokine interleukin-8-like domain-containing protein n=1 Tax=Callorhinchus milii TaxID=7868 RepID=A0A4W3H5W4_CALMI|eukprot:gi/632948583/ref/XP_007889674.1/ PREDICTED: interleukin-8-like [Callorhinchus milii]
MKMNTVTVLVMLLCVIATQGIPIVGTSAHCLCIQTTSRFIKLQNIQSLEYIPRRSGCESTEIIVTLKSNRKVCVNPDAKWVKVVIARREARMRSRNMKP